jgi:hypothetical protein
MTSPMMLSAIANRPPPPTPCRARKPMSCAMFWLRPASAEPARKMQMASWKIRRRPYRSEILPQSGVAAVEVSR